MTYVTDAHNRLLAFLAKEVPHSISVNPSADEFECRRVHVEKVAALVDDYFHTLAVEAAENSHSIFPNEWRSAVSDALHDQSLTAHLTDAADRVREDDEEAAAPAGLHWPALRRSA